MNITCNIDQRGRTARIVAGVIVDLGGSGLLIAGILNSTVGLVITGALISAAGTFLIVEGTLGWCAARAMGFRTKL